MFEDIISNMRKDFDIKPMDVMNLNPLVLAYIGDAVYEVYIRTMLVSSACSRTSRPARPGELAP
jgi:ribonuclease-3 family protein